MSRSCCPDCNRWRCVCLADECDDGGPVLTADEPARFVTTGAAPFPLARVAATVPPPTYVREKLAALRAEFAASAVRTARRAQGLQP